MVIEHGGIKRHLDDFSLTIGVGCEVKHTCTRCAHGQIYLTVACDSRHVETFDITGAHFPVAVYHIIDGALVVLLEHTQPDDVLAYKEFLCDTHHLELTVTIEDDDIVNVRTVAHKLVFLQSRADKTFTTVDVEFLVSFSHFTCLNGVEIADLRESWVSLSIFILQELEPRSCYLYKISQVTVYLLYLGLDTGHQFVGFLLVEFQNALHLDFQQAQDIVLSHLTYQLWIERCESVVDMLADLIYIGRLLEFLVLIDTFFDEYLFQRAEMILLQQFVLANLQFLTNQVLGALYAMDKHIAHRQELWLVIFDDTAVGRDVNLTIREGIQGIDGLVAADTRSQMYQYLHFCRCQVVHTTCLDLTLLNGFGDAFAKR